MTDGGEEIPLNTIRLYKMEVQVNEALDKSGNLHVAVGFLQRIEWKELKYKFYTWLVMIRGSILYNRSHF